ncbi:MAG: polysaccharide deacetylase family protein [Spirochaetaceae bacterium]|jgi:peptidoglycan/xylan/chitin deacetylase (PgdA/CDA1 family)|nr:polysaccharide deacetylase family protein [Spirochaetaceae bacterium]
MKKAFFSGIFFILLVSFPLSGAVEFSGLDLSEELLLFKADSDGNGALRQSGVFAAALNDRGRGEIRQLTAFPERIDLLDSGRMLQVRNAFGVMRIPVSGGLPGSVSGFPSFSEGAPVLGGRVESMVSSEDGRWILTVEPESPAYGNLVLINAANGSRTLIAGRVERPSSYFPASWSPDSRVFVYQKENRLYYFPINTLASPVDERYRAIGTGSIQSINWGRLGEFYYLKASTIYRVRSFDLFARALYTDFLETGTIAGTIPFEFDPNFDRFWMAPDAGAVVVSKGGRNLFYYPLDAARELVPQASLPYVLFPGAASEIKLLWSPSGLITTLVSLPKSGGPRMLAYRLNTGDGEKGNVMLFSPLDSPPGDAMAISPDGTKVLFWGSSGAVLYDYINWKSLAVLGEQPVYAALWMGNDEVIIAARGLIERRRLDGRRSLICLSQADDFGYEENSSRIAARSGDTWYVTDGLAPWTETSPPVLREKRISSSRYRVYLENQGSSSYVNIPMVRNTASVGTFPLVAANAPPRDRPPDTAGEQETAGVFSHGRREGLRETALVFDCVDDDTGLRTVLEVLEGFGLKATFFLNGEFIRRHPESARSIALAGHETASMFYAPIDVSDARYRIDREFISRGLARNEDEFFRAAGAELALIWHAPYYAASRETAEFAAAAAYLTVGRDIDPLDWIERDDAKRTGLNQLSASDMIDRVMTQKRPGSIIPVRIGLLPGGRDDYLFNRVDVLLDALVRDGYSIVPVSVLMEHSR